MKPGTEALQAHPLFRAVPDNLLIRLNEAADLARVGPDETLFQEGDVLQELNLLLAGRVGLMRARPGGAPELLGVSHQVSALCISAALLGLPAPIGVQTLTSAKLIVLPISEIKIVLQESAELLAAFLSYSLTEAQALTQEIAALKLRSSAQRLAAYLINLIIEPDLSPTRFVLPFEKRFLAAHIGCSQENLSRAFAALRRFGVETQRGIVVIHDVAGLSAFAGNRAQPPKTAGPLGEKGCKA